MRRSNFTFLLQWSFSKALYKRFSPFLDLSLSFPKIGKIDSHNNYIYSGEYCQKKAWTMTYFCQNLLSFAAWLPKEGNLLIARKGSTEERSGRLGAKPLQNALQHKHFVVVKSQSTARRLSFRVSHQHG